MAALFVWTLNDVIGLALLGIVVAAFAVGFVITRVVDLWERIQRKMKGGRDE